MVMKQKLLKSLTAILNASLASDICYVLLGGLSFRSKEKLWR